MVQVPQTSSKTHSNPNSINCSISKAWIYPGTSSHPSFEIKISKITLRDRFEEKSWKLEVGRGEVEPKVRMRPPRGKHEMSG